MRVKNLYKPYEIELLEADQYKAKSQVNTFFEMVFILEGTGVQIINDHQLPYGPDKLFLIFPRDSHGFEIQETTRFVFIRFNQGYLNSQPREWLQKLEYIFHNHDHLPGCILKTVTDKPTIRILTEALLREQQSGGPHQSQVMQQLLNTIITVAARNIALFQQADHYQSSQPLSLLGYVHEHIYTPQALRVEKLAAYFNISPTYVSQYFKRETGESLQEYVNAYRLALIESRLAYTNQRLGEIATEFGFTDTSHLNKLFRKSKGVSPSGYRKKRKPGRTELLEFTPDHAQALREIYLEGRRHAFPWMPADSYGLGDFDLAVEGEKILVALHDQVVVGFVSWWEPDNFVHCLYVDPAFHGRGIGTRLLSECLDRIGRPAQLKCVAANNAAVQFYLQQKWTVASQGNCDEGTYLLMVHS
ncbi:MAG: GNAT family N-acetyltransferase [Dyadobacter sp.]|uniref:GNAT family N-acetyltransferase n=1 Tax=Dyadobacter sp. TaxID=1914288 RepID=UPI001B1FD0A8|nr:GNAT family N-acetyltransferase [Dyadobacter sp.]MBO9616947.1 GNAT family N-acetyltransferase [Dyadobacter sp.]